jgi:ribonucleoside-triphosphate reductase
MITRVIKRDGREVAFNIEKIALAIHKALDASAEPDAGDPLRPRSQTSMDLAVRTAERLDQSGVTCPTIEQIQDTVEQVLMESGYPDTARRYILYRSQRTRVREMKTHLMQTFHAMNPLNLPEGGDLSQSCDPARPESRTGAVSRLLQYGQTGACSYNLLYLLRPEISQAHQNRDFFLQDLEYYALTFADLTVCLQPLTAAAFAGGRTGIRRTPDIRSYAALTGAALRSICREISGCPEVVDFEQTLAEGVTATRQRLAARYREWLPADQAGELARKETVEATFQAMEAFLHQENVCFLPETDWGRPQLRYGMATAEDARLVVLQLLAATGQIPSDEPQPPRPRQIFCLKAGVNLLPDDPDFDLFGEACLCAARTRTPEFALTGRPRPSLAAVTINLPRCAILARSDLNLFYHRLKEQTDLAREALCDRWQVLQHLRPDSFPFLAGQLARAAGETAAASLAGFLTEGALSIGFTGLAETLVSLTGRHHGQSSEAENLGREIVRTLKQACEEASEATGLHFQLLASQNPSLDRDFAAADRRQFGSIAGVTSHARYTPGFSLPDRPERSLSEKIQIEAPYHQLADAGRILSVPLPAACAATPEAIRTMIIEAAAAGIAHVRLTG